eukprot:3940412-Rhodomonas_salina.1
MLLPGLWGSSDTECTVAAQKRQVCSATAYAIPGTDVRQFPLPAMECPVLKYGNLCYLMWAARY